MPLTFASRQGRDSERDREIANQLPILGAGRHQISRDEPGRPRKQGRPLTYSNRRTQDQALRVSTLRAYLENRCPQGLVGSSPTPSAIVMSRGIVDGCRGA
jgi:hypothetical protein